MTRFLLCLILALVASGQEVTPVELNYTYEAQVLSAYDGDTITALISLGFDTYTKQRIRLHGIDAPEVTGPEKTAGLISRDKVRELIAGKEVLIKTLKDKRGSFSRYLGIIYINGVNLNQLLLDEGLAKQYQK